MKMRSFNYFLTTFLAISTLNFASANTEKLNFSITPNRVISLELTQPTDATLPTFLFLPGVNRGLLSSEPALKALMKKGFGVVTMNFSTQPISVNELPSDVEPAFLSKSYSMEELGSEVTSLANALKKNYNITNIIPVSISFSGAVSSTIGTFPIAIDAAPMSEAAAVNPQLEAYRATLKAGEIFNPIYGPGITRSLLDQVYYTNWTEQVNSITKQFALNADRKPDMIKGYSVLSRAAEGFVWDLNKTKSTKRVFIFGKKDSAILFKSQLQLLSKALEAKQNVLAFIVNDAGHIIPDDQPASYASILTYVATKNIQETAGVFEVKKGQTEPTFYTGEEAKKYVKSLISTL